MNDLEHISFVKDGSIVLFLNSAVFFMKVCNSSGVGGVVSISSGKYFSYPDLDKAGIGRNCYVLARIWDEFIARGY